MVQEKGSEIRSSGGCRCDMFNSYIYFLYHVSQLLYSYTDVYLHINSTFDDGRFTCVNHYVAANMVDTIPLGTYQSHHTQRQERIQGTFHHRYICSVVRYVRLYVCIYVHRYFLILLFLVKLHSDGHDNLVAIVASVVFNSSEMEKSVR